MSDPYNHTGRLMQEPHSITYTEYGEATPELVKAICEHYAKTDWMIEDISGYKALQDATVGVSGVMRHKGEYIAESNADAGDSWVYQQYVGELEAYNPISAKPAHTNGNGQ